MKVTLELLVFLAVLATVSALSCLPCSDATCKVPTCTTKLVPSICGCCQRCAKAEGQTCGGMWGSAGECDDGLSCVMPKQPEPVRASNGTILLQLVRLDKIGVCRSP